MSYDGKAEAYVAEHGETALDRKGEVHGTANAGEPLDRRGRKQALELGKRLRSMAQRGRGIGTVYHSPAKRAAETAAIAAREAGLPTRQSAALRSLDAGELGHGNQEAVARSLGPYFRDPGRKIPGGETVGAWRKRHLWFMRRVAKAAKKPPVFVTHSNVVGSVTGGRAGARRAMADPPPPATPIPIKLGGRQKR